MDLKEGTILESTQKSDRGRRVQVFKNHGNGYLTLQTLTTGRRSRVSEQTARKYYRKATSEPSAKPKATLPPLTTDREVELMRIVKSKFSDFEHRQQHFYLGGGMSTSHIVVTVMADIKQIQLFWPKELIHRHTSGGTTYQLQDKVFERAQNAVRDTLTKLAEKGYLEKVGNSDERRWRPTYRDV